MMKHTLGSLLVTSIYHALGRETPEEIIQNTVKGVIELWASNREVGGMVPLIVMQNYESDHAWYLDYLYSRGGRPPC